MRSTPLGALSGRFVGADLLCMLQNVRFAARSGSFERNVERWRARYTFSGWLEMTR
jgi:hypothetical protein